MARPPLFLIGLLMYCGAFHRVAGLDCYECLDILDEEQREYVQLKTNPLCAGVPGKKHGLEVIRCQLGEMCTSVRGKADIQVFRSGVSHMTDVPVVARTCWPYNHRPACDDLWGSYHDVAMAILTGLTGREVPPFREGEVCYCDTELCPLRCAAPNFALIGSYCVAWWKVLLVCLAVAAVIAATVVCCYRRHSIRTSKHREDTARHRGVYEQTEC